VLDGEVATYNQQLRSRFDWLRDPDPDAGASPPLLMVFDLLYRDGRDLTARPLHERRARLEDVVAGSERVFPVRRLTPDGLEAWRLVLEQGYEGYVAKDEASVYEGGATRRWLKVKQKGRDSRGGPLRISAPRRLRDVSSLGPGLAHAEGLRYAPGRESATELDAFYLDHRRCGELEARVKGPVVWIDCECGATIPRRVPGEKPGSLAW